MLLAFGRSLIYIMKSKGPSMDPCGTPVVYIQSFRFGIIYNHVLFPILKITFEKIQKKIRLLFHSGVIY